MSIVTNNNRPIRKTLSSQLDRLEAVLDKFGNGLPDAIGSAVKEAVGVAVTQAVQAVVVELFTNPAIQEQLQNAATPIKTTEATIKKSLISRLSAWVSEKVRQAGRTVKGASLMIADRIRKNGVAAAGIVGVVAYAARARIASTASAVCGWAGNLATTIGSALGRVFPGLACCG